MAVTWKRERKEIEKGEHTGVLWGTQYVHVRKGRGERRGKVREKGGK
jgi:hypothetical protein